MLETVNGIPAHPLFVHFVVVLLPLSAIGMIALVLIPRFRGRVQFAFIGGALLFSTGMAFVAKESGEKLNQEVSVSLEHQEWGERTFIISAVLLAAGAIWIWLVNSRRKSIFTSLIAVGIVVLSLGAITSTILAGDSGAKSVWDKVLSDSTAQITTTTSTTTDSKASGYTLNDVAAHTTPDDCWSVVGGNVYDLTDWISQHPGGAGDIENMCGIDATQDFNRQHGGQGRPESELQSFRIGQLSQ